VHAGGKAVVSYFFGPYADLPVLEELEGLVPKDAVLVGKHGEAAVKNGVWPVLGDALDDKTWPLPVFKNKDPIAGRLRRVEYSDNDLLQPAVFEVSDDPALIDAPEDGAMGTGFVEKRLSRLLGAVEADAEGAKRDS
jgi:hypothetical protein